MNGRLARLLFAATCLVVAILLLTHVIKPVVSGVVFALALAVFGGMSNGFRGGSRS